MKPLHLEITAFGPFADTEQVDFTKLPDDHPFLIGGPTGAGKTSVLDAMTYALFGKVPDDARPRNTALKSDHADEAAECRVSLTFVARGERCRISRTPKQFRRGKRSPGQVEKPPTALLEQFNAGVWQPVESKIIAIDKRMQETVGLTMEQFCKVAVLPQGRFQQVLNAGTTERVGLLRSLFGTEVLELAVGRMDTERKSLRQGVKNLETAVCTQRSGAAERIVKLNDELVARSEVPSGSQGPESTPVQTADVIDLVGRRPHGSAEAPLVVGDDRLRRSLSELSAGPFAQLLEDRDTAAAASGRAASQLTEASAESKLISRREELSAKRRDLDVAGQELGLRSLAIAKHRAAEPIQELLDRVADADEVVAGDAAKSESALRCLLPLVADEHIGFSDEVRTQIAATGAVSADNVDRLKVCAETAERQARSAATELAMLVKEFERISELEDERDTITAQMDAKATERTELSKHLASAEAETRSLAEERTRKAVLAARLDELDQAARNVGATLEARRDLEAAMSRRADEVSRLDEVRDRIRKLEAQAESLVEKVQSARTTAADESALRDRIAEIDRLAAAMSRRDELLANSASTAEQLSRAEAAADSAMSAFVAGSASVLADSLEDGEPCPVCGSAEHPSPAAFDDDGSEPMTADRLDVAMVEVDAARTAHDSARLALGALLQEHPELNEAVRPELADELNTVQGELDRAIDASETLSELEAEAAEVLEDLGNASDRRRELELSVSEQNGAIAESTKRVGDDAELPVHELEQTHAKVFAERSQAREAADRMGAIDDALGELAGSIVSDEQVITVLAGQTDSLEAKRRGVIDSLDQLVSKRRDRLGDAEASEVAERAEKASHHASELRDGLGDLTNSLAVLAGLRSRLQTAIAGSDFVGAEAVAAAVLDDGQVTAHEAWIEEWKRSDAVVSEALDQLRSLELPDEPLDLTALERTAASAAERARALDELAIRADAELSGIREVVESASDAESEALPSIQRLALLDEVHGVLSGNRTANYLAVEAWVLSSYLGEVVATANVHLRSLTGGRFSLEVDSSSVVGNAKRGLDLAVVDADTGRSRPTHTLSGGETFQASLALALGFADVLTSGAAGLQIDALFIDEGFGTLDADSVDTVVDVLDSLRSRGAMVGLISHVEAMKEALPVALEVQKRPDHRGSRVRQELCA
ncbi:MAG: AAA family ATPase [Microthrixaceae bacterium]